MQGIPPATARAAEAEPNSPQLVVQTGHGLITAVGFSPDGKRIVTGSWDQTARVWDADTGKELRRLTGHTVASPKPFDAEAAVLLVIFYGRTRAGLIPITPPPAL